MEQRDITRFLLLIFMLADSKESWTLSNFLFLPASFFCLVFCFFIHSKKNSEWKTALRHILRVYSFVGNAAFVFSDVKVETIFFNGSLIPRFLCWFQRRQAELRNVLRLFPWNRGCFNQPTSIRGPVNEFWWAPFSPRIA